MNHLMYADDICLLALTAIAMQQLLDICNDYGVANDITFIFIAFIIVNTAYSISSTLEHI